MKMRYVLTIDVPADYALMGRDELAQYIVDSVSNWYGQCHPDSDTWQTMTNAKTTLVWGGHQGMPKYKTVEYGYDRGKREAKLERARRAEQKKKAGAKSEAERLLRVAEELAK